MGDVPERRPGEVLDGRYRLIEPLGAGGFGDVWRADELLPGGAPLRQVALKLLHQRALDWAAEARIIASLRHPALVTVYAAGLLELARPTPFVAMELLEGESLAERVRRNERVAWRRVLAWAREAAAALDTIHRAGVVHLDLKPANLFLPRGGDIKVLDFGIARRGRERAGGVPVATADEMSTAAFMVAREQEERVEQGEATLVRSILGTPGFMAPEIFEEGEPGAATDAYSLAACIVQLVTGLLPQRISERPSDDTRTKLHAWFAEVHEATVRGQVRDLAADHPELPRGLTALLQRWLSLDPQARAVEAGSMRGALDAVWACPHGWHDNPYRGLAAYRPEDEGTLPARGPDVARIARELADQPCVVLQGASGTGVRSLVLAGIVPELARSFADGRDDWRACLVELGDDPDEALAQALPIREESPTGLVVVLAGMHRLLRVERDRWRRVEELARELAAGVPGLRLIGTLHEEYTAAFLGLDLGEALRPALRFITAPQASLVHEMIDLPARAHGLRIERAGVVIADLVTELGEDGARLSLASQALHDWWDGPRTGKSWQDSGGLVGAAARHADRVIRELQSDEQELADALLLRMVSADGDALDVTDAELAGAADVETTAVLERLVTSGLVHRRAGRYRLAHPGLAEGWPRLRDRRLHDLDRLAFLESLREAAQRWHAQGRARAHTWSAAKLRDVDRRRQSLARDVGELERAFIAATRRAVRMGLVVRGALLAAVAALVAGALWLDRELERRAQDQQRRLEYAQTAAAIGHMVTRSRRTSDPYLRVALLAGAIRLGSEDAVLPLELLAGVKELPHAQFLSLQKVPNAIFPWGERFLLGGSGSHAVVLDMDPPGASAFGPMLLRFRPHAPGLYDFTAIPFDTAFVTRGLDGELRVWRLREEGRIALAAVSPMRCLRGLSAVIAAARAPVIACSTSEGLARWDLRKPGEARTDAFQGRLLHVSDDGEWLAAARLRKVLLWHAPSGRRFEIDSEEAPNLARFSPRDPLVALVRPRVVEILSLAGDQPERIFQIDTFVVDPVDARWSDAALDFAVCDHEGEGEWLYLRNGGRPEGDTAPPASTRPCRERPGEWPRVLDRAQDYQGLVGERSLGPRIFEGGWRFKDGRYLTRDLVIFDRSKRGADALVRRDDTPEGKLEPGASVVSVVREGPKAVAWQVGRFVRIYDMKGTEILRAEGNLLGRCPDEKLLAWRKPAPDRWEVFAVRNDVLVATIARRPGFVVGADPDCRRVFVQHHDGTLLAAALGDAPARSMVQPAPLGGAEWKKDGYAYDARPSAARGDLPSGLWVAFSSGALLRIDGSDGRLRSYGQATPRATAMTDGIHPGELLFADDTGVVLRAPGARDRVLLAASGDRSYEDLRVLPDGRTVLLSWAHGVAMLDLERGEILHELELQARGRLASWDDEGSLLVWPFSFEGHARGDVIPIGPTLAGEVASSASNLRARLSTELQPLIELAD